MTGTGFYISNKRLIVTNHHVIKDTKRLKIITSSGAEHDIFDICSKDEVSDIAILRSRIEVPQLLFANDKPKIGDEIAAIGSPMEWHRPPKPAP